MHTLEEVASFISSTNIYVEGDFGPQSVFQAMRLKVNYTNTAPVFTGTDIQMYK